MPGIDNGIATSLSVVGPITTKSYGQTIFTSNWATQNSSIWSPGHPSTTVLVAQFVSHIPKANFADFGIQAQALKNLKYLKATWSASRFVDALVFVASVSCKKSLPNIPRFSNRFRCWTSLVRYHAIKLYQVPNDLDITVPSVSIPLIAALPRLSNQVAGRYLDFQTERFLKMSTVCVSPRSIHSSKRVRRLG